MNKFLSLSAPSVLLLSSFLITGCGSSDGGGDSTSGVTYNGNTSPAAIDANNAEAIGKAAGESVQVADSATDLPTAISIDSSVDMAQINNIVLSVINSPNLPAGVDVSAYHCTTGSATSSNAAPSASGEYNTTITFTNCRTTSLPDYDVTLTGTVVAHIDNVNDMSTTGTGYSFSYRDFSVTDHINGTSSTFNMTLACTNSTDFNTCTYSTDFLGSDNIVHRIAEYTITGDNVNGFYGTATFFHGTHGEVTITITNITYGDCGGYPVSGEISFSSTNNSSGTITFNDDCTSSGTWTDPDGITVSWPENPPT